jgi:hypothetical protein
VSIAVDGGTARWLRLSVMNGGALAQGTDALSGSVPPGSYLLTAKLVGRPILSAAVEVPPSGLTLRCALREDGVLSCTGSGAAVELR